MYGVLTAICYGVEWTEGFTIHYLISARSSFVRTRIAMLVTLRVGLFVKVIRLEKERPESSGGQGKYMKVSLQKTVLTK
jgi:hypothetical protein